MLENSNTSSTYIGFNRTYAIDLYRHIHKHSYPSFHLLGHSGFTIRSYFQYILWLFYLNIFTFLLCFTCIVLPTYIYTDSSDFTVYVMNQYNRTSVIYAPDYCTLHDEQCTVLGMPSNGEENSSNATCLGNTFTASSCCSLHNDAFWTNSSHQNSLTWSKYISDMIDGTVRIAFVSFECYSFTLSRVFLVKVDFFLATIRISLELTILRGFSNVMIWVWPFF
jgi:hypothetical protein